MAVARKFFPAILGALMCATQVGAQQGGTISGKVVDSATAQPLVGVQITVDGTDRRALTTTDGTYRLGAVPGGSQIVRARRIGYAGRSMTVTVPENATVTVTVIDRPA